MMQALVDPNDFRTNTLQEVFFFTRQNQTWTAIGYKVFPGDGVGTLYRFSGNNISATNGPLLSLQFSNFYNGFNSGVASSNYTRIMDGVVNFRIRAYDINGNQYTNQPTTFFPGITSIAVGTYPAPMTDDHRYIFLSNSLPAYVEVELGVLEDRTLARYNAILGPATTSPAATSYLMNHPGQVHIFRQRIPIRNVSSAAYQ
jgi:hypothetical protein